MALVGEAELGGQPRQLLLAAGQAIQRGPDPETHAVSGDGVAGGGAKEPAEVGHGHVQRARQVLSLRSRWSAAPAPGNLR